MQLGPSVHDPEDPVGKFLFNALAMVAEFEADLNRQRTMEGLAVAREQGRLRGKPPKLNERRAKRLLEDFETGTATVAAGGGLRGLPGHGVPDDQAGRGAAGGV